MYNICIFKTVLDDFPDPMLYCIIHICVCLCLYLCMCVLCEILVEENRILLRLLLPVMNKETK